jgi:hypothetical protein
MNENVHHGEHIAQVEGIKGRNQSVIAQLSAILEKRRRSGGLAHHDSGAVVLQRFQPSHLSAQFRRGFRRFRLPRQEARTARPVRAGLREWRWRAPQPVTAWDGVFHVDRFASMCLQALRSRTMNHYFGNEAVSEDCLYLNVWAPKAAGAGAKLPVIVWIYGGGFNVGSASMANYAGANLASNGIAYVSIAYRLGPLGFLAHPRGDVGRGVFPPAGWRAAQRPAAHRPRRAVDALRGVPELVASTTRPCST